MEKLRCGARRLSGLTFGYSFAAVMCGMACLVVTNSAFACDGRSYNFDMAVGDVVSGGGLTVRLDRARLIDDKPDKYYISLKDDGRILADHVVLHQHDTVSFQTKCGTVSIGGDRKLMSTHMLAINWSYF